MCSSLARLGTTAGSGRPSGGRSQRWRPPPTPSRLPADPTDRRRKEKGGRGSRPPYLASLAVPEGSHSESRNHLPLRSRRHGHAAAARCRRGCQQHPAEEQGQRRRFPDGQLGLGSRGLLRRPGLVQVGRAPEPGRHPGPGGLGSQRVRSRHPGQRGLHLHLSERPADRRLPGCGAGLAGLQEAIRRGRPGRLQAGRLLDRSGDPQPAVERDH